MRGCDADEEPGRFLRAVAFASFRADRTRWRPATMDLLLSAVAVRTNRIPASGPAGALSQLRTAAPRAGRTAQNVVPSRLTRWRAIGVLSSTSRRATALTAQPRSAAMPGARRTFRSKVA